MVVDLLALRSMAWALTEQKGRKGIVDEKSRLVALAANHDAENHVIED